MTDTTATDASPGVPQDELDALGFELDALNEVIAQATARAAEIKTRLSLSLDFGAYAAGPLKVSIQHNVTRDNEAFMAAYPFEERPDLYKPAIDTKAVNELLSKAELRRFQREGQPKVVATRFED